MNQFTERYKSISNSDLLKIIDKPEDYQILAVEAAKQELANRQLSDHEIANAKTELKSKTRIEEDEIEKKKIFETQVKEFGIDVSEAVMGISMQTKKPGSPKIVRLLSLSLLIYLGFVLYDNFEKIIFLFQEIEKANIFSFVIVFRLSLIATTIILFWKHKRTGWILLATYLIFNIFGDIIISFMMVYPQYSILPERIYKPITHFNPFSLIGRNIFYVVSLWLICKSNLRQIYLINKKSIYTSISIAAGLLLLILYSTTYLPKDDQDSNNKEEAQAQTITKQDSINSGIDQYKSNDTIEKYSKAIILNPKDEHAYIKIGYSYWVIRNYKNAILNYSKAIELNPKNGHAYFNRAYAYADMKDYKKELADYSKVIELYPKHYKAYFNRANRYQDLLENEKAISDYSKVIELNPENYRAYVNRASVYWTIKDYENEMADYSKAIEINPKNEQTYYYRGNSYYEMQDYEKAFADYSKAIELNSKYYDAYDSRALIFYDKKNYSMACQDWKISSALGSKVAEQNIKEFCK